MIFSLVPSLGYLGKRCSEIHVHDFVKMCVIFSLGYIYLGMKLLSHMKLFNFLKNANKYISCRTVDGSRNLEII